MERNELVLYLDIPEFSEALHASKWRTDIVLPQAGDNICPENLLSEKTLAMLETVFMLAGMTIIPAVTKEPLDMFAAIFLSS